MILVNGTLSVNRLRLRSSTIYLHNDVVDGNVYKLYEESDEAHDGESYGCGYSDLLEFWKDIKRWRHMKLK